MRHRVLIVDDEQAALNLFSSVLKDRYDVETARSAEDALQRLGCDTPYAVILADVFLPGMSGIELLAQCAKLSPDTIRISLTGDPGRDTILDSVNYANVYRFIAKPVRIEVLAEVVEAGVQRFESLRMEREMMDTTVRTSVNLLLEVLATVHPTAFELSQRIRGSVRQFARSLKLTNLWELELASSLARIGTVALPAELLHKVSRKLPLTAREAELFAQVPQLGSQLLKQVPRMDRVAQAIRYQAKNYDGTGSPADNVARNDIPLGARLLRVFADRAVLEDHGVSGDAAHRALAARGGVYDPALLDASFRLFEESILGAIQEEKGQRQIPADELQPDLILLSEIRTEDNLLLVAPGTRLTRLMVQRIQTHVAMGTIKGPFVIQPAAADPAEPAGAT